MSDSNTIQYKVEEITPQDKSNQFSLSKPPNAPKKEIPKSRHGDLSDPSVRRRLFAINPNQSPNLRG